MGFWNNKENDKLLKMATEKYFLPTARQTTILKMYSYHPILFFFTYCAGKSIRDGRMSVLQGSEEKCG